LINIQDDAGVFRNSGVAASVTAAIGVAVGDAASPARLARDRGTKRLERGGASVLEAAAPPMAEIARLEEACGIAWRKSVMKMISTGAVIAALALLATAAPATFDADAGGIVAKSAEARVFKGGSSQRVGSVNPADPGPLTNPVPNTKGGGGSASGGGSGGGGGGGGGGKSK
jgi:hypothetical protein